MVKKNGCKKGEELCIHEEATKHGERSWIDSDPSSDRLSKWRLLNECLFHYLFLSYVFLVLAKAKTKPAPAKPVNEDDALPLPTQRKLKTKCCSLVESQTWDLHARPCEQLCQDCFRWHSG